MMVEIKARYWLLLGLASFLLTFAVPLHAETQKHPVTSMVQPKHPLNYPDIIKHYIEVDTGKKYPDSYTSGPDNDHLITVKCPGSRVMLDYDMDYSPLAAASGAKAILLNPKLMKEMPWQARLFAFKHECGHLNIGDDESDADHYAVKKGVEEGWLKEDWLKTICDDYGDAPSDGDHPSGKTRCIQNAHWFAEEMKNPEEREPVKPSPEITAHPLPAPTFKGDEAAPGWRPWWWNRFN